MTRTTTRTNEHTPNDSFVETTTGDAPSSVEVSLNAKGNVQWSIKLYYPSPDEMHAHMNADLVRIDEQVKKFIDICGYTLAGK